MTINAAEMIGIAEKVGSLEAAKQGSLLIMMGTPLHTTSNIDQAYIQGRELNMLASRSGSFQKCVEKVKQQQPKPVP